MTTPLASLIRRRIRAEGPITVAQYMALAIAHPEHGYYVTRDPLGREGDFVTAPEISQMYGEVLGLWAALHWQAIGAPDPVLLVELGPGRGTLMADALRAARTMPGFRAAARVHLVETSPVLRAAQRAKLAGIDATWHDALETVPEGPPLLVIANEFFDCMPIRQFQRAPQGWREILVDAEPEGAGFRYVVSQRPDPAVMLLPEAVRDGADVPIGAIAEISPAAILQATAIAKRIAASGGAALVIDYGYSGADWAGRPPLGSIQSLRAHAATDPLVEPGSADVTVQVDFHALAVAAREAGAATYGPLTQRDLLRRLGIERRAEQLAQANPPHAGTIAAALDRLIVGETMALLFKALAIARPGDPVPPAFQAGGRGSA